MGSPEDAEIAVWVCQEEKLVCGLTRRTSCAQVVRALLEDHLANAGDTRLLHAPPKDYCIVEKWRGFERLLPPPTKLLRLWALWGEEQANVHLVLVKSGASLPAAGLRTAEAKVVQNTEGPQRDLSPAQYIKKLPADKQKRMVRKAFKKLARMKKLRQGREGMETLVHLIVSQDHTIRQQLQRMGELDGDIDRYESRTHLERIQKEGENYVQETYLLEGSGQPQLGGPGELQDYLQRRDATLRLEREIEQRREAIEKLTAEIHQELAKGWAAEPEVRSDSQPPCSDYGPHHPRAEAEKVESELESSMGTALQLRQHLLELQEKVKHKELLLGEKAEECEHLVEQLESVHLPEDAGSDDSQVPDLCKDSDKCTSPRKSAKNPPGSRSDPLSPPDLNDTDSDTGISSTHSQDSEPPCVEVFSTSKNYL